MKILEKAKEFWAKGRSYVDPVSGVEYPDPTPVQIPVGFERPESIQETIRRLVRDPAMRADLENADAETFEEADDFDIPDDLEVHTPYEENFDPLHLSTREEEVRLGAVKPLSIEEKQAAAALVAKAKDHLSKKDYEKAKKAAAALLELLKDPKDA